MLTTKPTLNSVKNGHKEKKRSVGVANPKIIQKTGPQPLAYDFIYSLYEVDIIDLHSAFHDLT